MAVTVRLFAAARAAVGRSELVVQPGSVEMILAQIAEGNSDFIRVLPQCSLLINELACHDHSTKVKDGDVIDVLPPFAGG